MSTATPEPNKHLKAGEINFDYIPRDWALTPLQGKRAYIAGWTSQPYTLDQIKREFDQGKATGVGLITCLLYTSPSPRDVEESRMPSSA